MRTLWKRLVCLFTLNHIDPGTRTEGDRLRCKKCGAGDGAERRIEGFIEKRRAAIRASNAGVPSGEVGK